MSEENTDSPDPAVLEEFRALRAEMLSIIEGRLWGQVTYGAIIAGLLSFADESNRGSALAALVIIAIPFLLNTIQREQARIRMGNYIRAVVEPKVVGLSWEAYVSSWRRQRGDAKKWLSYMDRSRHILALSGIFILIPIFSVILLIGEDTSRAPQAIGILGLAVLALIYRYFFSVYTVGSSEYEALREELANVSVAERREYFERRSQG